MTFLRTINDLSEARSKIEGKYISLYSGCFVRNYVTRSRALSFVTEELSVNRNLTTFIIYSSSKLYGFSLTTCLIAFSAFVLIVACLL